MRYNPVWELLSHHWNLQRFDDALATVSGVTARRVRDGIREGHGVLHGQPTRHSGLHS